MNYDRIKNIFLDLYKELSETFDDFESDFAEAIEQAAQQETTIFEGSDRVIEYFDEITQSQEAVKNFIKDQLVPAVKARQKFDVSSSYHYVVAKETRTSNIDVGRNTKANYAAFKRELLSSFGITQRELHELIRAEY